MTSRILAGVVAACLLVFVSAGSVLAHAQLEESDPADGATITTPYTLTATFSEEFDPARSFIRVQDASGERVAEGGVDSADPAVMTVELPELPPGEYTVRWQTVTPDDNGIENGTFTFIVEAPTPPPTATVAPSRTPAPSASTAATPAASPSPLATPTRAPSPVPSASGGSNPTGTGSDVILAVLVAAVVIGGVALYLIRGRR